MTGITAIAICFTNTLSSIFNTSITSDPLAILAQEDTEQGGGVGGSGSGEGLPMCIAYEHIKDTTYIVGLPGELASHVVGCF